MGSHLGIGKILGRERVSKPRKNYIPFTGKIDFRISLTALVVDSSKLVSARGLTALGLTKSDVDVNFFLSVNTGIRESSRGSSIFPFDARSAIKVDFSLYSRSSRFRNSVTPVRRREDTEGDGNAGVEVQIG